ncbi:hypothetical protein ES703_23806 [subsurface metagenome]
MVPLIRELRIVWNTKVFSKCVSLSDLYQTAVLIRLDQLQRVGITRNTQIRETQDIRSKSLNVL